MDGGEGTDVSYRAVTSILPSSPRAQARHLLRTLVPLHSGESERDFIAAF